MMFSMVIESYYTNRILLVHAPEIIPKSRLKLCPRLTHLDSLLLTLYGDDFGVSLTICFFFK